MTPAPEVLEKRKKQEAQFREDWIAEVCNRLAIETGSKEYYDVMNIYDRQRKVTELKIKNSFNFHEVNFPSTTFWYDAPKNFILNENGVLFLQKHLKQSMLSIFNAKGIELRQIFKRLKNECFANDDTIGYEYYGAVEYCRKVVINGLYGLSGFFLGAFFNIDCADTTTTGGRNIIAISNLTNEMLSGGYRPYVLDAYLKMVQVSKEHATKLLGRFTLPEVSSDVCLQQMLGYQYENYPYKTFLLGLLDKCTPWERSVIYLKNNYKVFFRVPEVREKVLVFLEKNREEVMVGKKPSKCVAGPITDEIRKDFIDLCFGFFYYEGDYMDGVKCETLVDVFTVLKRKVTVGGDTDSGIVTAMFEVWDFLEEFSEEMGDLKQDPLFTNGAVPVLFSEFIIWSSRTVLWDYCKNIGVAQEDISRIDLECEHVIEQLHPTILKKNYVIRDVLKDYMVDKNKKLKYTGLKFTKSDSNKGISEMVEDTIKTDIFPRSLHDLDYSGLVWNVYRNTQQAIALLQEDDFILNKKTILKVKEDASYGDSRMKCVRLWNRLYPDAIIEIPGSFGVVPIHISKEAWEILGTQFPKMQSEILQHCYELKIFKICNTIGTRINKILDEEDPNAAKLLGIVHQMSASTKELLRELCRYYQQHHDEKLYNIELYQKAQAVTKRVPKEEEKLWKSVIPWKEIGETTFADVQEAVTKCAVPVDINTVPEFLQLPNIIDIMGASEFEQLLGPLINTMSVRVPRNKDKNAVVTSMLQTF